LQSALRRCCPGHRRHRRHVHGTPGEDPSGRSRRAAGRRRLLRCRGGQRGRLPRRQHPLHRAAGVRGRAGGGAAEPDDLVDGRAGAARPQRAPDLEPPSQSDGGHPSPDRTGGFRMKRGWIATVAVAAVVLSAAAGCGSSSSSSSSSNLPKGETMPANGNGVPERTTIGKGEGQLDLIAWQGYTEPNIVKPFEAQTGCQVHVTYGQTSDQMVTLMSSGNFDGVSASGDATLRLIAGKVVAPIDVKLIKDFPDISPKLQ